MRLISCLILSAVLTLPSLAVAQTGSAAPVRVRAGEHAGFDRIVFDWPAQVGYRIEKAQGQATVYFEQPATLDLSPYRKVGPTLIRSVIPRAENDGLAVRLDVPRGARLNHFLDGTHVVIDVFPAAAGSQAQAAPVKKSPPTPQIPQSAGLPAAPTATPVARAPASVQKTQQAQTTREEGLQFDPEGAAAKKKKQDKEAIEFDIDDPPDTPHEIAEGLTFGAEVEAESRYRSNFDLDDNVDDDDWRLDPTLNVALDYMPVHYFELFADLELSGEYELRDEDGRKNNDEGLVFEQLNVTFRDVLDGLSTRVGRQRIKDDREWLYDEELDGVNLFYRYDRFGFEASVNQLALVDLDLLRKEESDDFINYFAFAHYKPHDDHQISAYLVVRDHEDISDELPVHAGGRVTGEIVKDFEYWLQGGVVAGRTLNPVTGERNSLRGLGADSGATYTFDATVKPSVTLAFAYGSGDDDSTDGTDRAFRQTGLHDNQDRFNGVTRFKYYGEVLDPDLSNLFIYTAGVGIKPSKRTSLDVIYHYYDQSEEVAGLRDTELGQEVDIVLGVNEIRNLNFEVAFGYFFPGDAFPSGADSAWQLTTELSYEF